MSHAKLFSPSKADGWFACSGRPVMEAAFPDDGNQYSRDGTARHGAVAYCLRNPTFTLEQLVGYYVRLTDGEVFMPNVDDDLAGAIEYLEDWVEEDQDYVDTVRALVRDGGELFVEQRLDFRRFIECTDPDDGFGTGDAVVLKPIHEQGATTLYELIVIDRKTGYHEVPVEWNKQLLLYALGAYDEHSLVYDISRVRLIVHQRSAREWDCSVEELLEFAQEARSRAISVTNAVAMHGKVDQVEWNRTFLNQQPSESACAYCKAMATCPSMQAKVQQVVGADFDDMATGDVEFNLEECTPANLSTAMAAVGLLEDFCKAVRAEVERRLLAGHPVDGWGLELGREGARQWADPAAAEATLKKMRLKVEELYDLKLISPTTAEKLHKAGTIGPRQWPQLQPLITRAPAKPSVKPASVIKHPYTPPNAEHDFETVADGSDLA